MTADNWTFVLAAYGLAAVVLTTYWRFLVRRENELELGAEHTEARQRSERQGSHVSDPSSRRP
ncbi:MAG: hypothetical protein ACREK4_08905 [Candidatus Rokuibacteriota bacterium]